MELPNREKAYIPSAKLSGYLLSSTHAVGKGKARFFRGFGFDEQNILSLEVGLLAIAQTQGVVEIMPTTYGIKYIIDGKLNTPTGIIINIRTVWMIEQDEDNPRFVTAYPLSG